MSVRIEKNDIVIEVDLDGIADSPHLGTADLRSVNIGTVPGEASVNYKTVPMSTPPTVTALAYTVNTTTDTFTVASTTGWFNGMAIFLNTIVTSTGITINRPYWIGDLTATTFRLYKSPSIAVAGLIDVTGSNGSGTLTTYVMTALIDKAAYRETSTGSTGLQLNSVLFLDSEGKVWWANNNDGVPADNMVYIGNTTLTSTNNKGRGITMFRNYLIVFRHNTMDALNMNLLINAATDLTTAWTYGWESISGVNETVRASKVGQDDIMYYYNSNSRLGSISENTGSSFNPASGATYTENTSAIDLPDSTVILSIGELGQNLLIGTDNNKVYPWDRISPSFDLPIELPEDRIKKIISVNSTAYMLAGGRGRIYETAGSVAAEWKKIPDHISGKFEPYYTWGDVEINRGQMFVSFTASENDGTAINTMGGVWAIDLKTKALRQIHQLSHGNGGSVGVIQKNIYTATPAGTGLYAGWTNSAGTSFGIDTGSSLPYSGGETIIETEIIPIGNYTFNVTPSQYEFKLSRPLVDGESIELLARTNLTESYISAGVCNTAGALSDEFSATTGLENTQWIQMKAILTSTNTTPSRVPLKQFRISTP